jgi:hypothetical protein
MTNKRIFPFTIGYPTNSTWLDRLQFSNPKIVFEKGKSGAWDEFGVRDPALLVDEDGNLVVENDCLVMYYTGSTKKGEIQAIGRAISRDDGKTWVRDQQKPVLDRDEKSWDSLGTSTPWVVKGNDNIYRMYYRGYKKIYTHEAIGLATSENGIDFKRHLSDPILMPDIFDGLDQKYRTLMAVTNIVRMFDGRDLLTFEGFDHERKCQIFAAVSSDKERFSAFNKGYPIFKSETVVSWPVNHVANPRIISLEDPKLYLLTFNGSYSAEYSLGQAISDDLINWKEQPNNPILCPTGIPVKHPLSGRIEGGVIPKEDLIGKSNRIRMFFMSIPAHAYSHENAVIGVCIGRTNDIKRFKFIPISQNKNEINVIEESLGSGKEILVVNKDSNSEFPPRVVFFANTEDSFEKISFEFCLQNNTKKGTALISIGEGVDSAVNKDGIKIRFFNQNVYFKAQKKERNYSQRAINKLLKILFGISDWEIWFDWQKVASFRTGEWNQFSVQKAKDTYIVFFNNKKIGVAQDGIDWTVTHNLSIQSNGIKINVRPIEKI